MAKDSYELSDWIRYMTRAEVDGLKACANLVRPGERVVFVNIGAGAGTSALAMREARHDMADIYTVDNRQDGGALGGLVSEQNAFRNAGRILPHQILGDSSETGRNWTRGRVDLCFIDGDHTAPGLTLDIEAWLPHMRAGGVICFHDYEGVNWPDVKPVVDKLLERYERIAHFDTFVAYRVW